MKKLKHRNMKLGRTGNVLRIKMQLRLWKNDELILDTLKWTKAKIVADVVANWDKQSHMKGYLKVSYTKDYHNDLDFYDIPTFKRALSDFTEKTLTDDFLENK